MNIIRILPEKVASQIAAGEVIDRPASIVRELIDNSIDAGSDRIVLRIERGGKAMIRVSDNGVGMSRDDLLLCVERHATSKIETASDLYAVRTLGFRGEAIPSIASVAKMQIISRLKDEIVGHRLNISGGKLIGIQETGAPQGTTVEVGDIFYNLPARRKFLRAVKTETDHILDTLSRIAMPFAGVNFQLESAGKTLMHLPASHEQLPRIAALMGQKVAEAMVAVNENHHNLTIRAFLAPPDFARSRGDRLFFYINGRNIRDRLVTKSVMEGYGQRLMKGRYPQAVIFIDLDPAQVDVNVHPTKQEVRFRNSRDVFQAIATTVDKALKTPFQTVTGGGPVRVSTGAEQNENLNFIREPMWDYSSAGPSTAVPGAAEQAGRPPANEGLRVIGQVGDTYILCQVKDGLLIVDQHAAHERIVYESLKKGMRGASIASQNLLIPPKIELSVKDSRVMLERCRGLSCFGIEVEHFGGTTFLLRAVPALLKDMVWESFLPEILAELAEGSLEDRAVLDKVLTVMACHGAIRAGYRMSHEEMVYLLHQLQDMELPTNCPHGRPIFKRFTYQDMEKMFKRVL